MKTLLKDLWYGILHVAVAITAILFVCGATGINLSLAFLTVGIGTLLFHFITGHKLAILMGTSGSFIAGMAIVNENFGPQYVAGGVVMTGVLYLLFAGVIRLFPSLYDKFPKYILNAAVLLIALNLMPIGASMVTGDLIVAVVTILAALLIFSFKKISMFAFPGALVVGTATSFALRGMGAVETVAPKLQTTFPLFNLAGFTLIGVVALATIFESLGDSKNCANAQGIDLDAKDMSKVLAGNGVASLASGAIGGLPLTTYSENIGFIYLTGYKRPMAQKVSALVFIAMAFIPGISSVLAFIPFPVRGAMLLFLFALIGANSIKNMELTNDKHIKVVLAMLTAFYVCPPTLFSPIAAAMLAGLIIHFIIKE